MSASNQSSSSTSKKFGKTIADLDKEDEKSKKKKTGGKRTNKQDDELLSLGVEFRFPSTWPTKEEDDMSYFDTIKKEIVSATKRLHKEAEKEMTENIHASTYQHVLLDRDEVKEFLKKSLNVDNVSPEEIYKELIIRTNLPIITFLTSYITSKDKSRAHIKELFNDVPMLSSQFREMFLAIPSAARNRFVFIYFSLFPLSKFPFGP